MLDHWTRRWIAAPLNRVAARLALTGLHPDILTLGGLVAGLATLPVLQQHHYLIALVLILVNRFIDGLDGPLARQLARQTGKSPSAYGAYLDIVCDMLFYGAVVMGMALAMPEHAIWSVLLLFGFLGTSSSFLAYTALSPEQDAEGRGLFFVAGLAEGSETILFFLTFCLFPHLYPVLAGTFAVLCFVTTALRLYATKPHLP